MKAEKYIVFLDGEILGYTTKPEKIVEKIRNLRRKGEISYQVNVSILEYKKEVRISTDSGRIRRPLIVAKNIEKLEEILKEGKLSFNELLKNGIIELLDAEEEETTKISLEIKKEEKDKYTHFEIHPATMFGLHASLIPFIEHTRGDRINYGARMSGQALGIPTLAYKSRTYSFWHVMLYAQVPLVQTFSYKVFPFDTHPNGNNVVIAVISHPYTMQDAIVLNKSSVERGLFRSYMFRTYEAEEKKFASGQEEIIGIPQPGVKGYRGEEAYRHLDIDGIVPLETRVKEGDVLIGKISPLRFLGRADKFIISLENMRETSVEVRGGEQGIVDRVFITSSSEGNKLVKVVLREEKIPEIGDKFASKHGQKGVVGLMVRHEDMPFTSSGIVPDIIFNPHGIPSRMSLGHLLEILFGKIAALDGKIYDGTAFEGDREKEIVELLKKYGFEESGKEEMYDPITGKKYEVKIFIGCIYYLRLHHLVSNKWFARSRGPITLLTRQPTEGKAKEGGLRLGEMEKDVLLAHGATITLKERFDSDKVLVPVCSKCGLIAMKDYSKNRLYCPYCKDDSEIYEVEMSYAFKLLLQELISMHIYPKIIVNKALKKVDAIEFKVFTSEDIKKYAVAKISKIDVYDEEGFPIEGGIMDPRMGTVDPGIRCRTCFGNFATCTGHFGYIELAKPVLHPLFIKYVYILLRAFCKSCGKLLTTEEKPKLKELLKSLPTTCPHCNAKQPSITFVRPYTFKIEDKKLNAEEIREFLLKIDREDVKKIGIKIDPSSFVLSLLLVSPPVVRPSIVLETGERSEDDLTHKLSDIVRVNEKLKEAIELGAPQLVIEDLWEFLQYHVATYFDNELSGIPAARHRSGRVLKGLAQRLETKEGRFRYNLLGKRTNFSARSVVSPDPFIDIDEVGVPVEIAKELTVPVVVNEENIEILRKLILNGNNYPGVNYVIRLDGIRIKISERNKEEIAKLLDIGWIVERHLMNGDIVLFNRQPSLHRMSIMAHRVRITPGKTFRINLCTTIPYNADFDGDEMNLHVPQSIEAMAEAEILMSVEKHIRSPRYGGPIIVLLHDHISGLFLLTYGENLIDYKDAVQLIRSIDLDVEIPRKEKLSGKEIFSLFLPKISLEFKSNLASLKEEVEKEGKVIIKEGKLIQGVIDKKAVGENGKLLNRILYLFGSKYTKQFIEKISKLGLNYLCMRGFSISLVEYSLSEKVRAEIEEILDKANKKTESLIKEFKEDKLKVLIGRTREETLEELINGVINETITKINEILLREIKRDNEVFVMAASGARGSFINIFQVSGLIGQAKIMGKRISLGYYQRTFPHFEREDLRLEAKGFISNGYYEGLKPLETFFDIMNQREALMDKGVKTRQSGYLERRLIGALNDLRLEYDLTVRDANDNIIQFVAFDDGVDPYKIEGGDLDVYEIARNL
ncbi:MAG: DNA-directed RNA polymerase subunit A' [Candidatus Aenigmarchaeota archaeon]|nr:DNA-directed RNA polymerase subunit A' [Candidatus Aenigmarchaeota archaeon]